MSNKGNDCRCGCGDCGNCDPRCGHSNVKCPSGVCLGTTDFYDLNDNIVEHPDD